MKTWIILVLLLCGTWCFPQTVTISGTVSKNSCAYANGNGRAILVPQNQLFLVNGTNPVNSPVPIAAMDSFGHFSMQLTNTAIISPASANPQWQFSFCTQSIGGQLPACFTMNPLSLTTSQDISTQIQSQAAPVPGCSTGGTNPGGNNTDIQFNDLGAFKGSDSFTFDKNTLTVTFPDGVPWDSSGIEAPMQILVRGSNGGVEIIGASAYDGSHTLVRMDNPYAGTVNSSSVQQTLAMTFGNSTSHAVTGSPVGIDIAAVNTGGGSLDNATALIITPAGTNFNGIVIEDGSTTPILTGTGVNNFVGGLKLGNITGVANNCVQADTVGHLSGLGSPCAVAYTLPTQYTKLRCETGLGDGLNAISAGTYLQSFCYNDSGVTWTITGIKCFTDNSGTSTLNASGNTLGALLTGTITCSSAFAAGTQSANVALLNGDYIKFTFVADGTSKQTTWVVSMTQ